MTAVSRWKRTMRHIDQFIDDEEYQVYVCFNTPDERRLLKSYIRRNWGQWGLEKVIFAANVGAVRVVLRERRTSRMIDAPILPPRQPRTYGDVARRMAPSESPSGSRQHWLIEGAARVASTQTHILSPDIWQPVTVCYDEDVELSW